MKKTLQIIAHECDSNYDIIAEQMKGVDQKEVFMQGVVCALMVVNALDLLTEDDKE